MTNKFSFLFFLWLLVLTGMNCITAYQSQSLQYNSYRIGEQQKQDAAVTGFLQPYSDSVNKTMNTVISSADMSLERKQPEGMPGTLRYGYLLITPRLSIEGEKVSDEVLVKQIENIDLIIGGHSHTFFDNPVTYKNKMDDDVIVNQVGFAGIILGRLDFEFSKFSGKKLVKNHNISVSQKTGD